MRWRVERYEKEKAGRLELVYLEEVFGAKKSRADTLSILPGELLSS